LGRWGWEGGRKKASLGGRACRTHMPIERRAHRAKCYRLVLTEYFLALAIRPALDIKNTLFKEDKRPRKDVVDGWVQRPRGASSIIMRRVYSCPYARVRAWGVEMGNM
jgi:hypothetical protein